MNYSDLEKTRNTILNIVNVVKDIADEIAVILIFHMMKKNLLQK